MKATSTFQQATAEQCLNKAWQPLLILVFTLFFSISFTSHGGYLLADSSISPANGDKSESSKDDYNSIPAVFFREAQDATNQPPIAIEWDKTFGGNRNDLLRSAIPTPDGGYVLAGTSDSNASGDKSEHRRGGDDYWIVKVDVQGNKDWDKTIGGDEDDLLSSVVLTPDGGYLLAGYSSSDASGDKSEKSKGGVDYWIVKIDADGNKVWDKTIGGSEDDNFSSIIPTPDGGYLLAGESLSDASGDKSEKSKGGDDYWVVKIDADGNKVWDKTLGGDSREFLFNVISTADGGYLLAGSSLSDASGDKSENRKGALDYWAVKIDADGNKVWDKTIGGDSREYLFNVISTADGGYLLAGYSESNASGDKSENSKGVHDFWIVKTDARGNKIWDKTIGGSREDYLSSAISTPDGGYLLAGESYSPASGDKSENRKGALDYWAVKIDADGNKVWDKTIGGSDDEGFSSAISTPEGGYLLAGYSASNASGDKSEDSKGWSDYWIVKLKDQNVPVVKSFTLINAVTDQEITELKDGDVIPLAEAGSGLLNIRANTFTLLDAIDHVDLKLQGPISHTRTEQVSPYALFGDREGDYEGKSLLTGKYTLTVTPYTKDKKGASHSVSFQVVEEDIAQLTIEWDKTLGGSSFDGLRSTIFTPDGGYLLAGSSSSDASGDKSEDNKGIESDYWVVKIDAQGNKQWDKTFGGSNRDESNSVISTPDGGYLLAGDSWSDASGDKSENNNKGESCYQYGVCPSDYWIVKIDAQGNKIWDKTLGGSGRDELNSIISAPDGGYLLAGSSYSDASGDKSENNKGGSCNEFGDDCSPDYWIVKIDEQGNKIWDKTIGGGGWEFLFNVISTPDGGYLLAGSSESYASEDKSEDSKGNLDYWIVKIDEQGNKIWDKTIGGRGSDGLHTAIPTSDGGYLLAGSSDSPVSGDKSEQPKGGCEPNSNYCDTDYWVVKIDAQGNKIWDKSLGGSSDDRHNSAIPTSDGGYLLAGYSMSGASGDKSENEKGDSVYDNDYWIVKIDGRGNKIWDKSLGGNRDDRLYSTTLTPDGDYLLAGDSWSDASGDKSEDSKGEFDYWIVKLKAYSTPIVTSLTLMDAATDQEIKELGDGDVINLDEVGDGPLNIRANTSGPIDHVYLQLQDPVRVNRTEREFPYALFGDKEGDYEGRALLAGKYTLTVTPYGGIAHTISFEVIEASEATARQVKVYPVPTSDMINILHEGVGEEVHLMLLEFNGNMLLHQPMRQQPLEQVDLSGFKKGIYYLRVVSAEGVQVFRVVKE